MRSCCCVNQCPACGQRCQVPCGHRRPAGTYTPAGPNTYPVPTWPTTAPTPVVPIPPGRTHREPLTEEDIRRIIREEIDRDR